MGFKNWLSLNEHSLSTSAKEGIYGSAYTLSPHYPSSARILWGPDALVYMDEKDRFLKFIWGKGMLSDPSKEE